MTRSPMRWFLTRAISIAIPVIEILLIFWVGRTIGWLATILLLFAGLVVGIVVMNRAGTSAFRALTAPMQQRQPFVEIDETTGVATTVYPNAQLSEAEVGEARAELRNSGLVFAAGVLFAVPGFLTDVFAALLLVPPIRWLLARRWPRSSQPAGATTVIVGETVVLGEAGLGEAGLGEAGLGDQTGGGADTESPRVVRGEILPPTRPTRPIPPNE